MLRNIGKNISSGSYGKNVCYGKKYVVVIGGGPGGYVAAIKAAQLGLSTACVESGETLGGTCLNVGCIPSKSLLNNSHYFHLAQHGLAARGIKTTGVSLDLPAMLAAKEKSVKGLTQGISYLLKKNKADWIKGRATITGPNQIRVAAPDGSNIELSASNTIIATGSSPTPFPGIQVDETSIVTSTGALSLQKVPESMLVIGGGVIGLELGSVWSRLGAKVEVVEYAPAIGGLGMDAQVASSFQKILTKQGFKFRLGTKVVSAVKNAEGKVVVTTQPAAGGPDTVTTVDVCLLSIGRMPHTMDLGLDAAGVAVDDKGRVITDAEFKTNVPGIRAIGDVIAGPMLAHKAEEEGIACVEHLVHGHGHVNYSAIPSVVYTHPEVAWVGLSEAEAKEKGINVKIGYHYVLLTPRNFPFSANSRAKTNDDAEGFIKIVADADTDRMLGAHNAGEMIAEAVLAIEYGASTEDVGRTCHAHPTLSEAFKEACMAVYEKPIHA